MDQDNKLKAVFTIIESEKLTRPLFRRIGTAWVNRDASINIVLEAFPVSGKLHVRDIEPRPKEAATPSGAPAEGARSTGDRPSHEDAAPAVSGKAARGGKAEGTNKRAPETQRELEPLEVG